MSERNVKLDLEAIWGLVFFTLIALALMAFAGWLVWDWATEPQESYEPTYNPALPAPSELHHDILLEQECEFTRMIIDAEWLTDEERQEKAWFLANNCR